MTAIERRRKTVILYPGDIQRELDDLLERAMAAQRAEDSGLVQQRMGTASAAMELARQYDVKLAEAETQGARIELLEISHGAWERLADEHPPRKDESSDLRSGLNTKTFPAALLRASLGDSDLDVDELSQMHYTKLENAAWALHNEDDALPKFSLVSLLKQASEPDSKARSEQE